MCGSHVSLYHVCTSHVLICLRHVSIQHVCTSRIFWKIICPCLMLRAIWWQESCAWTVCIRIRGRTYPRTYWKNLHNKFEKHTYTTSLRSIHTHQVWETYTHNKFEKHRYTKSLRSMHIQQVWEAYTHNKFEKHTHTTSLRNIPIHPTPQISTLSPYACLFLTSGATVYIYIYIYIYTRCNMFTWV